MMIRFRCQRYATLAGAVFSYADAAGPLMLLPLAIFALMMIQLMLIQLPAYATPRPKAAATFSLMLMLMLPRYKMIALILRAASKAKMLLIATPAASAR